VTKIIDLCLAGECDSDRLLAYFQDEDMRLDAVAGAPGASASG
jgi:hypothetical protein